jgi:hypothetical protein
MSEDLKLIQYPERPLKITLQFKNKNIMHITILILPLGNIMGWDSSVGIVNFTFIGQYFVTYEKKKRHSLLNDNQNALCSNI